MPKQTSHGNGGETVVSPEAVTQDQSSGSSTHSSGGRQTGLRYVGLDHKVVYLCGCLLTFKDKTSRNVM